MKSISTAWYDNNIESSTSTSMNRYSTSPASTFVSHTVVENLVDEPFREKGYLVGASWDFPKSECYKWLEKNCIKEWNWMYLDELHDQCCIVEIYFSNKEDVKKFSNTSHHVRINYEQDIDTNYENIISMKNISNNKVGKLIDWCRMNLNGKWCWNPSYDAGACQFSFEDGEDLVAFKLKWS